MSKRNAFTKPSPYTIPYTIKSGFLLPSETIPYPIQALKPVKNQVQRLENHVLSLENNIKHAIDRYTTILEE